MSAAVGLFPRVIALLALILAAPAQVAAQTGPAEQAEAALSALGDAAAQLAAADRARDRVAALTSTIRAFEQGLGAMRSTSRRAAIRERSLSERLVAQDADVSALLSALQTYGRTDSPAVLLHPDGALGTARAAMLLSEIGPALTRRAADLRADLTEVQTLRRLQQDAAAQIAVALEQVQSARDALNKAMADRTNLPRRFVADPAQAALLAQSADTLASFTDTVARMPLEELAPPLPFSAPQALGAMPLPVQAVILRRPGEADAAGVARPGVLLATRPGALVTAPSDATIRFTGPLLDFGLVTILEPQADTMLIFAGLAQTYGNAGEVITTGTPVGLMGAAQVTQTENRSLGSDGGGTDRTEALYIEIRENNAPVDPATWFDLGPE